MNSPIENWITKHLDAQEAKGRADAVHKTRSVLSAVPSKSYKITISELGVIMRALDKHVKKVVAVRINHTA
jgi:hypothetical protein